MKITYDKKSDAMYIYLTSKKKRITETKEIEDGWIGDFAGNELVGIEIITASKILGAKLGLKPSTRAYSPAILNRIR